MPTNHNAITLESVDDTINSCNYTACDAPVRRMYHLTIGGLRIRLCYVHLYVLYDQLHHHHKQPLVERR